MPCGCPRGAALARNLDAKYRKPEPPKFESEAARIAAAMSWWDYMQIVVGIAATVWIIQQIVNRRR
jgi:hypothetical protein